MPENEEGPEGKQLFYSTHHQLLMDSTLNKFYRGEELAAETSLTAGYTVRHTENKEH